MVHEAGLARQCMIGQAVGDISPHKMTTKEALPLAQEDMIMAHNNITDTELADLIRLAAEAASAYIRGDVRHYLTLIQHADDYTLMGPFGGEVTHGFDASPANVEATERFFQGGEAVLDVVHAYTSGDLVVLVAIERQHGRVGGLPDQDWSLRVTWVFRRDGGEWRVVHRHADPLVHSISFEHLAALAAANDAGGVFAPTSPNGESTG